MMQKKLKSRQTDRQTGIRLCLSINRLWIGLPLVLLCFGLCNISGASRLATVVLTAVLFVVSITELQCSQAVAKVLTILWGIAATFITLFLCQLLLNESSLSLGIHKIILNMLICGIVIGFIYLITVTAKFSVIVGMGILLVFTAANYFVFMFRGSELCPADFLSIGTAVAVVERYTFTIDAPFAYAIVLAIIYSFGIFCIRYHGPKSISFRNRIICAISIIVMLFCVVIGSKNIGAYHFLQTGSVSNGYFLNFILQIKESIIKKPDGYELNVLNSLEDVYAVNEECTKEDEAPVIIAIMNESFADLSVLGSKIQTNMDILPFYNSLSDNTIKGYALSSVIGGGTANSEYEFLSGNSMAFLPSGSIVYQQFINDAPYTIIPYLNDLGYTTIATHPEDGKNWLRYSVYPKMGFDKTYFIENYPCKELVRGFVSDQEMYEQIIKWYEQCSEEEKLFLFGISMQNHGFYDYEKDDFQNIIQLEGYSRKYPDVEQYLTLLHESDKALEYLIDYFENENRDVVILFFGDHHPKLDGNFCEAVHGGTFNSLGDQMLQYTVPFFVWANFDIEEQNIELTSLNYLSNILLETAGIELPPYNCFLKDLQEVIPAMNSFGYYSKEQSKFISYDEATGIEADMLQKYQILQYNCIFDADNISEIFYSIDKN